MKIHGFFGEDSKINQIICAILINLPVLSYGASIGWMSPMSLLLQSKDSPKGVPLTDTEVSWMAAVPYLICIPANSVIAFIVDKFGRKTALIFVSLVGAASWGFFLISLEIWALIIARSLVGVTMSGAYIICPIYTKEISDDSIRGALGCFVILFHTIGNLFMYILGDLLSYYTILWVCLAIPCSHIVLFLFMPDSPSYLVKRERVEDATKAIAWLRCKSTLDSRVLDEINQIKSEQKKDDESKEFMLKTIFTDKILRKALQIALISTISREICGAIPVLSFAGEIFSLASGQDGILLSPNQQAMMLGAVQVVGSILASSVVEKSGRKPLLFISSLISGLSMCILASWFLIKDFNIITPAWIPLLSLCLCIFCDSTGLQPMSIVLAGEIFSFKYRGTVMAVAMSSTSICAFIQLLFFKPLANSIGIYVSFYLFGLICLLMAAYVIFVIPETRARPLEDIYKDLGKKSSEELQNTRV